jgi:hypothetical protein
MLRWRLEKYTISGEIHKRMICKRTGLRESHQIHADSLEFRGRHGDRSSIFRVWDTQMLLIDVHKLQVILAQPVVFAALEDQVQHIRSILSLDCQDILVLRGTQYFGERCEIHAKGNVAVATVWGEGLCLEHHGDERDVRVVHSLESDTGVIAVEVAILDKILDRIDDL